MALLGWLLLYFQKKKCHQCGKKLESAPAICKFCGYWFCDKHISQKNHNCKGKTSKYNRIMGLWWNVNLSFRYYLGIILMFLGLLWFLGNMKRGGWDFLIGLLVDLLMIAIGFILFITSYKYKKKKK
jgi:hypothetical protein